jgi:hypothetical protein
MYLNKFIKDFHMCYTNPTKYYDLYSDIITTANVGSPSGEHTIDIKDDIVAMHLSFDTDKFTIKKFIVYFPEKVSQCAPLTNLL